MARKKFDPDEYVEWLERVPQENREKIAAILSETVITTYDDVVHFAQRVMTYVLAGDIAPVAADAAVRWAEVMLTSLSAREASALNSRDSYGELINALTGVQEPAIEASYTTVENDYAEAVNE